MKLVRKLKRLGLDCQSIVPTQKGGSWLWRLYIDGVAVVMDNIRHIAIKSPWGLISVGLDPVVNRNSIAFREAGQGGAVIVPFILIRDGVVVEQFSLDCQVLIEVINQWRSKIGGLVWSVPRGFVNDNNNEGHLTAARRELFEEAEVVSDNIIELPGEPVNPNSSFFETGPSGGLRFFAAQLSSQYVVELDGCWQLTQLTTNNAEKISGSQLLTIDEAVRLQDGPTVIAVARLWQWLNSGRLVV